MAARALLLLAACLLLAASGSAQVINDLTSFPYCSCVRGVANSPYLMTPKSQKRTASGDNEVCYNLVTMNPDASGRCTRYDLRKIEFDIKPSCRGTVGSITFNSKAYSPSYTAYPNQKALTFKITPGGPSTGKVLGTYEELSQQTNTVCITLRAGSCDTPATFYAQGRAAFVFFDRTDSCCLTNGVFTPRPKSPTHPPSVGIPPSGFPYCACTRNVPSPTYTISGGAPGPSSSKGNSYCWTVTTNSASGSGNCVNYDLRKIEINMNDNCHGSVDSVTFNDQSISPSYTVFRDQNVISFKATRYPKALGTYDALKGSSVNFCIVLRSDSSCPTLESFCKGGSCVASPFSMDNRCCPVQAI